MSSSSMLDRVSVRGHTPSDLRELLAYTISPSEPKIAAVLRCSRHFAPSRDLLDCEWLGGGTDGFVLKLRTGMILKVRSVETTTAVLSVSREIAMGLLLKELRAPFVAALDHWYMWQDSDQIDQDFRHHIPDPRVRRRSLEHFCRSRTGVDISHVQPVVLEQEYTRLRTEFLDATRASKRTVPPLYLLLQMPYCGQHTLYNRLMDQTLHWSDRWLSPKMWPVLKWHITLIAHQLYILQRRYGFMHCDLNLNNVVLKPVTPRTLTREYRNLWAWSPGPDHQHLVFPTVEKLGGYVPMIVDISLATADYDLALRTMRTNVDGRAERPLQNLFQRCQVYMRTNDTRRLGLYLAFVVAQTCNQLTKLEPLTTNSNNSQLVRMMRERLDWRFVMIAVCLTSVSRQWLDMIRHRKTEAELVFERPKPLHADRRTPTFAQFVQKYQDLQHYLRRVMHTLYGEDRSLDSDPCSVVRRSHKPALVLIDDLIVDLNPHMDHLHRTCGVRESSDDPLLPENMLSWLGGIY